MWKYGDVWDIENLDEAVNFITDESPAPWAIVKIHDNISINQYMSGIGMVIDENRTLTVQADNQLENNWYLELNGTIDLLGDSQLVQTENSELAITSFGRILRRQEGTPNPYRYNYWSSPVGQLSVTENNTPFSLAVLKDENDINVNFTKAATPIFSNPVTISETWLYTYTNGITYHHWDKLETDTFIVPGTGYSQKGTNSTNSFQQYIFDGKPNNGVIQIWGDDVENDELVDGGPGESVPDVTLTNILLGNPYPSALDARKFISDNEGITMDNAITMEGTIFLWEQWDGNSHLLADYQGGYGFINSMACLRAYQYPGIGIEGEEGIKTPTFNIPVGQGFFVEVVNDGWIEFNNTQRIFAKESDYTDEDWENGSVFMRTSDTNAKQSANVNEEFQIIRLEFGTSAGASRQFILGFNENSTDGFDYGLDGGKIPVPQGEDMGSIFNDQQIMLQAFSPITPTKVIDLFFNASGNYTYSLKIDQLLNIDPSQGIYLRDNQENVHWDLNQGPYNFTAFAGEDSERFDIVFQPGDALSNEDFKLDEMLIYAHNEDDKLFIRGLEENVNTLTITNILGQTIKTYIDLDKQVVEDGLNINYLSSGIYIVNVETDNKEGAKKIIIN